MNDTQDEYWMDDYIHLYKPKVGYMVSGSRCKNGRFYKTLKEAKKEMDRQMMTGARESGIMEVECEK
ncbi:hypothetical protein KAX02_09325 [candidate division WOR-3 bacterium]|nr:hypothetical protein [candidate division WOR-3 bacterium]